MSAEIVRAKSCSNARMWRLRAVAVYPRAMCPLTPGFQKTRHSLSRPSRAPDEIYARSARSRSRWSGRAIGVPTDTIGPSWVFLADGVFNTLLELIAFAVPGIRKLDECGKGTPEPSAFTSPPEWPPSRAVACRMRCRVPCSVANTSLQQCRNISRWHGLYRADFIK